jgi:AcrR family transcriptional regulator
MPKISAARKEERRRQILEAAMARFAQQGFQQTTILDICAEAGLSAGAVYSYFRSKDAIIEALQREGEQLADLRAERALGSTPPGRLGAFLQEFGRPGRAMVNQYDLRIWAEAIGNRQIREAVLASRERALASLVDILTPVAAARGLAVEALAELVLAVIAGCEVRRALQPAADVVPVVDVLVGLLGGLEGSDRSAP